MSIFEHTDLSNRKADTTVFPDIRDWRVGDRLYGYGNGWDGAVIVKFTTYSLTPDHPEQIAVRATRTFGHEGQQRSSEGLFSADMLRTMYAVRP